MLYISNRIFSGIFLFCLFSFSLQAAEKKGKKKICLNMIVKNEKEVITRCLESVLPIIDTWVIVDTGSTDGTQKVIKQVLKKIPGELHERPWVNFGHNRQEALLLAKQRGDYILFMDADDILEFSKDFCLPDLTKDFYAIPSYNKGSEYWFPRLVKADLEWFWEGVIHEDLLCKNTVHGLPLQGVKYLYFHDGARAKDPKTAENDILFLEEEVKKFPNHPRNVFYLARSYISANQPEKALENFKKRIEMTGNDQEVFYSHMMIGALQDGLHFDSSVIEESFFKAYLSRPHRAEPLYYLACKLCQRKEFEKSYEILSLALQLPADITDYMCLEKWIYDYGLLFQFMVSAAETGRYSTAIQVCQQLMRKTDLPENVRSEVAKHFEWAHQKNIQEIGKKLLEVVHPVSN